MPKPATLPDLADVIRRSRLVDDPRLDRALADVSGENGRPSQLLKRLIADGHLTRFQADQLAEGRWRGFSIGGYTLLDRLGGGGMGQVYLAEHVARGRPVAIKMLTAELVDDDVARRRFAREARAAVALAHPNIVCVYDFDLDADPPFLVMEYIDGVSLQAAVSWAGTFSAGSAAYCGREVALGLQGAAAVGLVHRDIKPANVLVDRRGRVKILDLGVVRVADERSLNLTLRTVLGTADYLAPEQARDSSAVDARADLYALGGTLYFLLTGHPPFPSGTQTEKISRKQTTDPPLITDFRPDLPAGLVEVIHRLLARDPADRYQTPQAAAEALAPFATPDSRFPGNLFAADRSTVTDLEGEPTPSREPYGPATGPRTAPVPVAPLVGRVVGSHIELSPARGTGVHATVRLARPSRRWLWALAAGLLVALAAAVTVATGWGGGKRSEPVDPQNHSRRHGPGVRTAG
jgi:serine/threonine-protein kinase